jgi:hypothetical protein
MRNKFITDVEEAIKKEFKEPLKFKKEIDTLVHFYTYATINNKVLGLDEALDISVQCTNIIDFCISENERIDTYRMLSNIEKCIKEFQSVKSEKTE